MNVDYIIVGLGLAGLAFAENLIENNKTFIVFENHSQNASLVAGGVYNPVVLKRFTPVWNGHQQLAYALPFYQKIADNFNQELDTKFNTKKVLKSVEDENNWFSALDKPTLSNYMLPKISRDKIAGVISDIGFGELTGTGRIDTKKIISTYRAFLAGKDKIRFEKFKHHKIMFKEQQVVYQDIITKKIVFCEGYGVKDNPFFNTLPLKEAKGELLTIYAPDLQINFLLKSAVFVLPIEKDIYKVGATFNWKDKTVAPTEDGKNELIEKLKKVLTVPYKIIEQTAGIRPTVKDRRPLVGVHLKHPQLAVLNGLGTRGVMIAPTVAKNLYNHLEKNEKLDLDIDIKRFG
ncbi:NAD(P)/FAD-dependent oxidoreductase [Tenacibaculum sp. UWU-22]|uniref:NAD(P)/FAD-dependent oxidoreductase n=1 Tax=Tenacibaculum sp. UWU-22 TaxID=3234187 RepID=UPI0034DAFD07